MSHPLQNSVKNGAGAAQGFYSVTGHAGGTASQLTLTYSDGSITNGDTTSDNPTGNAPVDYGIPPNNIITGFGGTYNTDYGGYTPELYFFPILLPSLVFRDRFLLVFRQSTIALKRYS